MFLRATKRFKDGKVHDYWSMVLFPEDRAPETDDGRVVRIRMDRLTIRNVRNRGEAYLWLDVRRRHADDRRADRHPAALKRSVRHPTPC